MDKWTHQSMPGLELNVPSIQDIQRLNRLFPAVIHPLMKPRLVMENAEEAQVIGGVNFPPLNFAMADQGFVAAAFDVNRPTWQATVPLFALGRVGQVPHQVAVLIMNVTFNVGIFKTYTGGPFTGNFFDVSFANIEAAWVNDARRAFVDLSRRVDAIVRAT